MTNRTEAVAAMFEITTEVPMKDAARPYALIDRATGKVVARFTSKFFAQRGANGRYDAKIRK